MLTVPEHPVLVASERGGDSPDRVEARAPVLVVLCVRADGRKVLLDLRLAGDESTAEWSDTIRSLVERNLGAPVLAVIDGSTGSRAALPIATQPVSGATSTGPRFY